MPEAQYTDILELDLATVEPSLAGPKRPQDRVPLRVAKETYRKHLGPMVAERATKNPAATGKASVTSGGKTFDVVDGAVLIAAITSCTNTSNPYVLMAAGLLARNARRHGLVSKPWVKTSLAPGSRVVTDYLQKAGLLADLEAVGFYVVGYGCTTCIGNSGPLRPEISEGVRSGDVVATSVLSGNRNFEGRVHAEVKMNFLASPPLVVAYALAGTMDIDMNNEPIATGSDGKPVYLKDIWPSAHEVAATVGAAVDSAMFKKSYASVFTGDEQWQAIDVPQDEVYRWEPTSTYVRNPPYFQGMTMTPGSVADIRGARALAVLGDSVTTDHISPAGNIAKSSPAAKYLMAQGVQPVDFNQYGARRGNHEVMMRGTFANIRLRNLLLPGTEGGVTLHVPSGEQMSIFDAATRYKAEGTPLVVLAGKEYGTGSSRDWAAKGTMLLGVRAVIAESFERIHRSNLIGMGVLPLQFKDGENAQSLGLTRQGKLRDHRPERRRGQDGQRGRDTGHRHAVQVRGARAHRHAQGARVLPARRHPAVRDPPAGVAEQGRLSDTAQPGMGVARTQFRTTLERPLLPRRWLTWQSRTKVSLSRTLVLRRSCRNRPRLR